MIVRAIGRQAQLISVIYYGKWLALDHRIYLGTVIEHNRIVKMLKAVDAGAVKSFISVFQKGSTRPDFFFASILLFSKQGSSDSRVGRLATHDTPPPTRTGPAWWGMLV